MGVIVPGALGGSCNKRVCHAERVVITLVVACAVVQSYPPTIQKQTVMVYLFVKKVILNPYKWNLLSVYRYANQGLFRVYCIHLYIVGPMSNSIILYYLVYKLAATSIRINNDAGFLVLPLTSNLCHHSLFCPASKAPPQWGIIYRVY